MKKFLNSNTRITHATEFMNQEEATELSDDESQLDYDSEDEDLTNEDKHLRRAILRNFIANNKVTKQNTGKFTNMQMTFPEENNKNRLSRRGYTPVDTE